MKDFLKTFTAVVLGTALVIMTGFFMIVGSVTSMIRMGLGTTTSVIPDRSIMYISFENSVVTQDSDIPTIGFLPLNLNISRGGTGFLSIVRAIEQATDDPSVRMIYLDPQYLNAQMTHIEEIRNALISFRQSGKPVISYAMSYSQQAYYLASAADKVILNPDGDITLQGFSLGVNYYKGLMDKLGLEAQVIRHGNYKSGGEPFTASRMGEMERQQMASYLTSCWEHWSSEIDNLRHLKAGTIDSLCSVTFLTEASKAKEIGLVDELWHKDEMISYLSSIYNGLPESKLPLISLENYISYREMHKRRIPGNKIALVYATGDIAMGKGMGQIFAESFADQLRQYRNDSTVKAVVVHIESAGGDPLAAGIIARELQLTAANKPVTVSMGDIAASGGYWIACAAHKIYVHPSTLTGSIGVYSLLFNGEKGFSDVLRIRNETVDTHPFSHIVSWYHRKSERELQIIRQQVESTYNRFVNTVANNRHMERSKAESLADGRVWSGKEAIVNGLADHQGGLSDAVRAAADMAGLTDYRIVTFPKPFRLMEMIGRPVRKASAGINTVIQGQIQDLLGEGGILARLPFDEKAISW